MSKLNVAVVVKLFDQITSPVRSITQSTGRLSASISKMQSTAEKITGLKQLQQQTGKVGQAITPARQKLAELGRQMKATENPTKKLQAGFQRQLKVVQKLSGQHKDLVVKTRQLRTELKAAGIDTRKLGDAETATEAKLSRLNRAFRIQQGIINSFRVSTITGGLRKVQGFLGGVGQKAANMALIGQASSQISSKIFNIGKSLFGSVADLDKARGELATLGIKNIEMIVNQGRKISAQYAGITAAQFTESAYAIKSGIATLTDEGVAMMTRSAAITAKATKAAPATMTSLFATAHGIFKRQFKSMSDQGFGDLFSASIAKTVQQFKTEGRAMEQAISSATAGPTNKGMGLYDQLTALGMMQQVMPGAEAGTALRSFAENAAKAHEKLSDIGIDILDEHNMLRKLPDILKDLKAAYGDILDAVESQELAEAFGTQEAMKVIDSLYGQEDAFIANAKAIKEAGDEGLKFTEKMARAADSTPTARITKFTQRLEMLKEKIAGVLMPEIDRLIPKLSGIVDKIGAWVNQNRPLIVQIGKWAIGIGAATAVIAPLALGISAVGGVLTFLNGGISVSILLIKGLYLGISLLTTGISLLSKGLLFLASPLVGLIALVSALAVGGVYLIYKNWEPLVNWFGNLWESIKEKFNSAIIWILEKAQSITSILPKSIKEKLGINLDFSETIQKLRKDNLNGVQKPVNFKLPGWGEVSRDFGIDIMKEKLSGIIPKMPGFGPNDTNTKESKLSEIQNQIKNFPGLSAMAGKPSGSQPGNQSITISAKFDIHTGKGSDNADIAKQIEKALKEAARNAAMELRGSHG